MPLAAACALVLALCAAVSAGEHKPDPHLSDPAAVLYKESAFAHGYIHGYEAGFHAADQDLQFGRLARGTRTKPPSHPEHKFASSDPASARAGYRAGFDAGYRDAAEGREFRAVGALRVAAAAIPPDGRTDSHTFDAAFRSGYFAGRQYAEKNQQPLSDFGYITSFCVTHLHIGQDSKTAAGPCNAYTSGFRIGYGDQRVLQPERATASSK